MAANIAKMPMLILKYAVAFLLVAGSILLFLRYTENRTLFYPTKEISSFPDMAGLDFQDVLFKTTDNIELNGWYIPSKGAEYTVLFCHGNAGNISHRIEKVKFFNELGLNVFIFDYEGYGKSRGRPSEQALYRDVKAAYEYLLSRGIESAHVIGYGESLGGAIIVDLAFKEPLRAIILDSTLTSTKDMVKCIYPFMPYWVFASRLDSEAKVSQISIPKLIIHSKDDEIIPFRLGKRLYEAASPPKEFLEVHGGHNSNFFESENVLKEKIGDFIKDIESDSLSKRL